ncbi:MAG: glyoxalase/bleomycin resistance/extradiol dioxygenase family protein [Verrucomicrobiota bacterium]
MNTKIFITLPVRDLARALAFYKALGYPNDPQFTDDNAPCIVISEHIQIMLLTHSKFREFSPKDVCDTSKAIQVLHSLTCETRAQVDDPVRKAIAAGGSTIEAPQDYGFMYHHGFVDPDGHCWGLNYITAIHSA